MLGEVMSHEEILSAARRDDEEEIINIDGESTGISGPGMVVLTNCQLPRGISWVPHLI